MTTSVPTVIPVSEITWQLAVLLQESFTHFKLTGDRTALDYAHKQIRTCYEGRFKEATNRGYMSKDSLEKIRQTLERFEAVARH